MMIGDTVDGGGGGSGTGDSMVVGGSRPGLDIDDDPGMAGGGTILSGRPERRFLSDGDDDLAGFRKSVFWEEDGKPGGPWNSWGGGGGIRGEGASGGVPSSGGSSNLVVRIP